MALEAAGTLADPRRTPLEDLARDDQNRRLHEEIEKRARAVPSNYWARLSFELKVRIWLSYRFARLLIAVYGVKDPR